MKQGRKHRGFTLVELVVAAGALALLAVMVMTFTGFGNQVLKSGADSYDIQSGIRVAGETAVQQIRYASAIFTIPESTFKKGESGLTADWNYFGVEQTTDDKGQAVSQIVNYIAKGVGHEKKVIAQSPPGTTFDIRFSQKDPEAMDKLIQVEIVSYLEGQSTPYSTVETEVDALNALQVVDKYPGAKCTAIAYRTDERPTEKKSTYRVNVVMVLDASGSMSSKLNEYTRTYYLREAGKDMIELLKTHPNIDVAYVTYSNSANDYTVKQNNENITVKRTTDFVNVYQDMVETGACTLLNFFCPYVPGQSNSIDSLYPSNNTNTGDGIRRAYHMLSDKKIDDEREGNKVRNYIIVMTDGQSNYASYTNSSGSTFFKADGTAPNVKNTNGQAYANEMGKMCKDFTPYLIGLAAKRTDSYLRDLQNGLQCPEEQYFVPSTGDQLKDIFGTIAETIVTETWHLTGPDI